MKKTKKFLLFCVSTILALTFLITPFPTQNKKNAVSAPIYDVELIDETLLSYVSISIDGQTLTQENIKSIDTDDDSKLDTSYVFSTRSTTLTFDPFTYGYEINFNSSHFYDPIVETIEITKDGDEFPTSFTYNETDFTYQIIDDKISIRNTKTATTISESDFISYEDIPSVEPTKRIITFVTSYSLDPTAYDTSSFTFIPSNSTENFNKATQYTINFEKPIVDFGPSGNNPVASFLCTGLDIGDIPDKTSDPQSELSYENLKFEIINNNYTETNPLYFDINHDGFIYTFKLFSKKISSHDYLFVEYYDENKSGNNKSLATTFDNQGNLEKIVDKFYAGTSEFNTFSIDFNVTGRYEIMIYDETYRLNLSEYNFYSTSFYIKTSEGAENSAFKNAYAILQSYDDEGNFIDYIVDESTQNDNVKITLKNLDYYFENDPIISSFVPIEDGGDLNVIEFVRSKSVGGANLPEHTFYNTTEIKEALAKSEDFIIDCTEDAYYHIYINQFNQNHEIISQKHYQFAIVKKPKISFTYIVVDENGDPEEDANGQVIKKEDQATIPYKITPVEYKINITNDDMRISTFFKDPSTVTIHQISKTYLNEYIVDYAMQQVSIEKTDIIDPETDKVLKVLGLKILGIGEISVKVTVGSTVKEYIVESGNDLVFEDYGVYSVSITDSMGTTTSAVFSYKKPVSTSAIILAVLLGVIGLAIVLFVIASRGKLKTR